MSNDYPLLNNISPLVEAVEDSLRRRDGWEFEIRRVERAAYFIATHPKSGTIIERMEYPHASGSGISLHIKLKTCVDEAAGGAVTEHILNSPERNFLFTQLRNALFDIQQAEKNKLSEKYKSECQRVILALKSSQEHRDAK